MSAEHIRHSQTGIKKSHPPHSSAEGQKKTTPPGSSAAWHPGQGEAAPKTPEKAQPFRPILPMTIP